MTKLWQNNTKKVINKNHNVFRKRIKCFRVYPIICMFTLSSACLPYHLHVYPIICMLNYTIPSGISQFLQFPLNKHISTVSDLNVCPLGWVKIFEGLGIYVKLDFPASFFLCFCPKLSHKLFNIILLFCQKIQMIFKIYDRKKFNTFGFFYLTKKCQKVFLPGPSRFFRHQYHIFMSYASYDIWKIWPKSMLVSKEPYGLQLSLHSTDVC